MSHAYTVLLDTSLRNCWYGQGPFGVSKALKVSADMKRKGFVIAEGKGTCSAAGNSQKEMNYD
jgi:hypothetical protein